MGKTASGKIAGALATAGFYAVTLVPNAEIALAKPPKAAAESTAGQAKTLAAQALVAYENGKYAEAAELYRIAFRLDPRVPDYLFGVGKAEQKAARYTQAAVAFEQLLMLLPESDALAARGRKALAEVKAAQAEAASLAKPADSPQKLGTSPPATPPSPSTEPARRPHRHRRRRRLRRQRPPSLPLPLSSKTAKHQNFGPSGPRPHSPRWQPSAPV